MAVRFKGQIVRADVTFRGGGGHVVGTVFDDDGVTPLKASVAISGERVVIAGGIVGTRIPARRPTYAIVDTDFTTGQFTFDDLLVGSFTLSAVGQFSPDPIASTTNARAQRDGQMNLRLQPTSIIGGTVFKPDGVTPAGANVVVHFKSDAFRLLCTQSESGGSCNTFRRGFRKKSS